MYPQFEGEVKIEHLQGYLYVQQIIENSATANAGAIKEYSIYEIEEKENSLDLIDLAIALILDKLNNSIEIDKTHQTFFKENAEFYYIKDWEIELKENLNNWFADKYLSAKVIFESYKKYSDSQKDWTDKEKENYLEKGRVAEKETERKLKNWKPNSKYFIDLLKSILGTSDLEILKINVPKDIKNKSGFPFHEMNFTWGWDFDIFMFSTKKKKVILHLGNILT
jgi:hypothetical protein